uniref:Ig-like domain-containing protein n=1 Tax=Elaeophora elaphi TaxID=1147741 RepID=A0A0R3RQY1_9BILA
MNSFCLPILLCLFVLHSSESGHSITFPEPCNCYLLGSVHVMDCSHSSLERFLPFELILNSSQSYDPVRPLSDCYGVELSKVVELDLSHNKLIDVPNFGYFYHLKRLDLGYNKISNIPNVALLSLKYLEELNLSHNQISQISEVTFENLLSLSRIDFNGNQIKSFPSSLRIPDLRELYLDDNLIEDIPPELLNFSSLKTLSLAGNRIPHMQAKSLMKCRRLEDLNSAQNSFLEVLRQALREIASTLVKLNLSSTPISMIRSDDFINLLTTQEIDLSNTKIAKIEENSFRNLPKLLKVHLNDNPELKHIHYDAFQKLPSLILVHLHNCNLSRLHNLSLPPLRHLTLHGNPLLCDDALTWLQRFRHIIMDREKTRCISKNKAYKNLHTSRILEKRPPRIVGLPSAITAIERQSLILTCYAIGNPRPIVQWRDPADAEAPNGQFLMFEKINQNQSGIYRCLAYSEAGLAEAKIFVEVTSPLRLQVYPVNSTVVVITWLGKFPFVTSKLRVRFRDNSTAFVKDIEVCERERIRVQFFGKLFSDTVEVCLLDNEKELACDYFDNRESHSRRGFMFLRLIVVLFCFFLCVYSLTFKLKRVDWAVKIMRMRVNPEMDPTFYNSSTLAVQILTSQE